MTDDEDNILPCPNCGSELTFEDHMDGVCPHCEISLECRQTTLTEQLGEI